MLYYPMFAMFMLIFVIGIVTARARFGLVKSRQISPKYFRYMEGDDVPEIILKTNRCFSNQFEFPMLFFVVCLAYLALDFDTLTACVSAWLFVVFRAMQSYIHLTSNNVIRRAGAFWASVFCVVVMWIDLFILISTSTGIDH